jgi:hypothetical protein
MKRAQTWSPHDAARAAGMNARPLRQWSSTGVLPLRGNDRKSTGAGNHSGYSRPRILQAAITRQLNLHGVSVSRAAKAAFEFTDCGNMGRGASELFIRGRTLLCLRPDNAMVVNAPYDADFSNLANCLASLVAIDLKIIVDQVDAVLNIS